MKKLLTLSFSLLALFCWSYVPASSAASTAEKPIPPYLNYVGDQKAEASQPGVEDQVSVNVNARHPNALDNPALARDLKAAGITTQEQVDRLFSTSRTYPNQLPITPSKILADIIDTEPNDACEQAQPVNMGDRVVCGHLNQSGAGEWDGTDKYVFTLDNTYSQWVLSCSTYAPTTGCNPDSALANVSILLLDAGCAHIIDQSGRWGQARLNTILLPGRYEIGVYIGGNNFTTAGYYNLQFAASQYVPSGTPISESEPNDGCSWANILASGEYVSCGSLDPANDSTDYFAFTLDGSQSWWTVDLWTTPPSVGCSPEIFDTQLSLYNSDCSQLLGYSDNGGQNYYSAVAAYSLPPGDYVVKVATGYNGVPSGHYNLLYTASAGNPPPVNDNCYDITETALVPEQLYTFSGNNAGATWDCSQFASIMPGGEVWEAFSIDQTMSVTIDYCGTEFNTVFNILVSGCPCESFIFPSGIDQNICSKGEATFWWNNLPAGIYYIPIYSFTNSQGPYTIHIKAVPPPPPPPNDNCVDVQPQLLQPGIPLIFTGNSQSSTNDCGLLVNPQTGELFNECWIAFTTTETLKVTLDFCATTPQINGWISAALYNCPCESYVVSDRFDPYYCISHGYDGDWNPGEQWFKLPPGIYYYPVLAVPGGGQPYTIHVNGVLPTVADFEVAAPGNWPGNTSGAGDGCDNQSFEDQVWKITIPNDGNWTFSLCNTLPVPEYSGFSIYLGTDVCYSDIAMSYGEPICPARFPRITQPLTAGVYYFDVEGSPSCSTYQLDVYREPTPEFGVSPLVIQGQAAPGGSDSEVLTINNPGDGTLSADIVLMTDNLMRLDGPLHADSPGQRVADQALENKPISDKAAYTPSNILLQGGDNIGSATVISALPFSDDGTTDGYADDYNENDRGGSPGSPDVVYSYAPTADEWIDISLCDGTNWDTKIYVYMNEATPHAPYKINDDGCPAAPGVSEIRSMRVTAGNTYYIIVDGYSVYSYGPYHINVTVSGPPPGCYDADILFGQNPTLPYGEGDYGIARSDKEENVYGQSIQRYENFLGAFGSITEVKVYGVDEDENFFSCTQNAHTFDIIFLNDNNGLPGDTVAEFYDVEAVYTPTGWIYSGLNFELKEYDIALPSPVSNLNHGWISVAGSSTGDGCNFNWITTRSGDGLAYLYVTGSGYNLEPPGWEYGFCLIGTPAEPWVTIDGQTREHLEIGPYGSAQVNVRMNAAGLTAGAYNGNILFNTNDPFRPTGNVPIIFTVGAPGCQYLPGDINGNGVANGIDVIYGVGFFKGGPVPLVDCFPVCPAQPNPFYGAGDVNGSCLFNGIDITYFVAYLKGSQPALNSCPACPPAGGLAAPAVVKPALRSSGGQVTGGSE